LHKVKSYFSSLFIIFTKILEGFSCCNTLIFSFKISFEFMIFKTDSIEFFSISLPKNCQP